RHLLMRSLTEYRAQLEPMEGGTVPVALALEIIHAAEAELEEARGELSIAQAMERSGRSRSYFERRLEGWAKTGDARRVGRVWLMRAAVVPGRDTADADMDASPEDIVASLDRLDRAS